MTRHKWKLVLVLLNIVLISTPDRCRFASSVPSGQKLFWTHPKELLGDVGHVESRSVRFEMELVLM